jgi:hypothetical protein
LIDLAGEADYAQTFREVFQERGYGLWNSRAGEF